MTLKLIAILAAAITVSSFAANRDYPFAKGRVTPVPHNMKLDMPSIPERNFFQVIPEQSKRVYVITDVGSAEISKTAFIKKTLTWHSVNDEPVAYKVYVMFEGVIQHIYITPFVRQEIYLPKAGHVEIWVTSFNSSHMESRPSSVITFNRQERNTVPGRPLPTERTRELTR